MAWSITLAPTPPAESAAAFARAFDHHLAELAAAVALLVAVQLHQ